MFNQKGKSFHVTSFLSRKGQPAPNKSRADPEPAPSNAQVASEGPVNGSLPFALKLDPTHPYLIERGLDPELVGLFGLDFCSQGSTAGRICIPIPNEQGQLVAYAGRWPGDEVPEGEEHHKLPAKSRRAG